MSTRERNGGSREYTGGVRVVEGTGRTPLEPIISGPISGVRVSDGSVRLVSGEGEVQSVTPGNFGVLDVATTAERVGVVERIGPGTTVVDTTPTAERVIAYKLIPEATGVTLETQASIVTAVREDGSVKTDWNEINPDPSQSVFNSDGSVVPSVA